MSEITNDTPVSENQQYEVIKNFYVRQPEDGDGIKAQIQINASNVILKDGQDLQSYIDNQVDRLWNWFYYSKLQKYMPIGEGNKKGTQTPFNCLANLTNLLTFVPEVDSEIEDIQVVQINNTHQNVTSLDNFSISVQQMDISSSEYQSIIDAEETIKINTQQDMLFENLRYLITQIKTAQVTEEKKNQVQNEIKDLAKKLSETDNTTLNSKIVKWKRDLSIGETAEQTITQATRQTTGQTTEPSLLDIINAAIAKISRNVAVITYGNYDFIQPNTANKIAYQSTQKHIIINKIAYVKCLKWTDTVQSVGPIIDLNYSFVKNGMFK